MPSPAVWRLALVLAVLSVVATVLNVVLGAAIGGQVVGLAATLVAAFGAAWYTVGTGFPGALSPGTKGGVSGLVASGFALTLITGFWSAVQQRFSPAAWDLGAVVSLVLYGFIFLLACTLAFWCITELVLRDRARNRGDEVSGDPGTDRVSTGAQVND